MKKIRIAMTLWVLCALTFGLLPGSLVLSKNQTPQTVSNQPAMEKVIPKSPTAVFTSEVIQETVQTSEQQKLEFKNKLNSVSPSQTKVTVEQAKVQASIDDFVQRQNAQVANEVEKNFQLQSAPTRMRFHNTAVLPKIDAIITIPAATRFFDSVTAHIVLKTEFNWQRTGFTELSLHLASESSDEQLPSVWSKENQTEFDVPITELIEQTAYELELTVFHLYKDENGVEKKKRACKAVATFTTPKMPPPPPKMDEFDHLSFGVPDYEPGTQDNEYYWNYRGEWDLTWRKQSPSSMVFNVTVYTKGNTWYSGFYDVKITVKDLYTRRLYVKTIKGREQQKSFKNITFGYPHFNYDDENSWKRVEKGEIPEPLNYWQDHEVLVEIFQNGQKVASQKAEHKVVLKTRFRLIELRNGATIKRKDGSLLTKTYEFAKDSDDNIIKDEFWYYLTLNNISPFSSEIPVVDLWSDVDRDPPFNLCTGCDNGPRRAYFDEERGTGEIFGYRESTDKGKDPRELRSLVIIFKFKKIFTLDKMKIPDMEYLIRAGLMRFGNKEPYFPNGGGWNQIIGKTFDDVQPKP